MNLAAKVCSKYLLLYFVLLLAGCSSSSSTISSSGSVDAAIVDDGYQLKNAKHANQSNIMVHPNQDQPANTSLEMMLERLPGVRIKSGRGAYAKFVVDGTSSSFQADTSPLFVVNGMAQGTDYSMIYSLVHPNDVISVSVLKGSDASIYGTRGANGVILIRTK
jgi:TonB-dependent SusC/RagA subfamily outer membrane receptor